jgi:hypothetical protein
MITHLDHVYSYLKDNNLDDSLARFGRAGFLISPEKRRHTLGMLNGFVILTGTYLEFISIIDDADFQKNADDISRILRKAPHPYGIGAVCLDPQFIYDRLSPIYSKMDAPYSRGAADSPEDIRWTFCPIPLEAAPGAYVFPLKYHKREKPEYEEKKGPNTIFGIGGFYFCSDAPESRIDTWTKTLQSVTPNFKREGFEISFGCQKLRWLTKQERERIFGDKVWDKRTFLDAEICGIRLLAESLTTAKTHLEQGGFQVERSDEWDALIATDPNSAFTLVIEEGNSAQFLASLNSLNPEKSTRLMS